MEKNYRRTQRRPPYRRQSRDRDLKGKKKQFIKKSRELIILDILPYGHPDNDRPSWTKQPVAQVLTFPDFVLYEVRLTDRETNLNVQDKDIYENFIARGQLKDVLRKIDYNDLTTTSKALLEPILEREVVNYEEMFINFFNNSTSITPRMHALKLLPGIGQKHMWEILEARDRQKFTTFQDIIDRTSISNPAKLIAQRIIKELQRDAKYYIFSKTQRYE
ncbi:MAG: DUF655 domain-containing protein [Promethearchaeota archaeon]